MTTRVLIKPTRPALPGIQLDLVGTDSRSGGVGGWQELTRPRRKAAVEWLGTPQLEMTVPLLIDGTEVQVGVDVSIEPTIRKLISWALKDKGTGQPPIVRLDGPISATQQQRWVIQTLEWGAMMRNQRGQRVQQYVTVTFLEYLEAEVLKGPARKWKSGRD